MICVIIPGYNEGKNIARVVREVCGFGLTVLVVDDGSKDDTAEQAQKAGAEVVSYQPNRGKGAALQQGIQWFLKKTSCEAAIFMDSDGQHRSSDLSVFLKEFENSDADMVIGNRMSDPKGMPWLRRATNRLMSALLSGIAGQQVPDTQCGYRLLRRGILSRLKLQSAHFEVESEMILEVARLGGRIVSVPIHSVYEGGGSHIQPGRDTLRFIQFLWKRFTTKS